jgi:hypothetical protein
MDRSTSLAAPEAVSEACPDAGESPRRDLPYCRTKVPLGVVEAINGNIKSLLRRDRGYKSLRYLLLKAQRMAVTRTEFVTLMKAA